MSLYGLKRYNSPKEKTDLMMSLIPELCSICELSTELQFTRSLRDSKVAEFVKEVATMSEFVILRRQGPVCFERVLKENITSQVIDVVIKLIGSAAAKFHRIENHLRNWSGSDLQRAGYIIDFLHILCGRLNDGYEWKVDHEFQGPYTLYIMNEDNTWRAEKNPVSDPSTEPADNPATVHHPFHFGPGSNPPNGPQHAQLCNMLIRVQHSMR